MNPDRWIEELEAEKAELKAELDEANERIEELEHELDGERDNDGYIVIDGVYEEDE